jgi:hypothetical protein
MSGQHAMSHGRQTSNKPATYSALMQSRRVLQRVLYAAGFGAGEHPERFRVIGFIVVDLGEQLPTRHAVNRPVTLQEVGPHRGCADPALHPQNLP